jgi:hypothetical protein
MIAFISKYTLDVRIAGWIKPTYLECKPDTPEYLDTAEELKTLTWLNH